MTQWVKSSGWISLIIKKINYISVGPKWAQNEKKEETNKKGTRARLDRVGLYIYSLFLVRVIKRKTLVLSRNIQCSSKMVKKTRFLNDVWFSFFSRWSKLEVPCVVHSRKSTFRSKTPNFCPFCYNLYVFLYEGKCSFVFLL